MLSFGFLFLKSLEITVLVFRQICVILCVVGARGIHTHATNEIDLKMSKYSENKAYLYLPGG